MIFGMGQTELTWGVASVAAAADVVRIPQEAKQLGATALRMTCLWMNIDPTFKGDPARMKWTLLDAAMVALEDAGLDIMLCIEPRRSVFPIAPAATQSVAFGKFCGAVASRYGDRIAWYEIGNEVNNAAFFGGASASRYSDYLREAFNQIMPHAPAATVLAGALQTVGTGFGTVAPSEWVQKLYDTNSQPYFHGLSYHPYCMNGGFEWQPVTQDAYPFQQIDQLYDLMVANGDGGKKIWATEWGFDNMTTVYGATNQTELDAEQALKLSQQWTIMQSYVTAGVIAEPTFVFMYRDWELAYKKANKHYGLVRFDYTKKPAWTFIRSQGAPSSLTPPVATPTVTVYNPTVGALIDTTHPKVPGPAVVTATTYSPAVITPVRAPVAEVSAAGWAPSVQTLAQVQYVSTGAGDRDTTGTNDVSLSWSHLVAAGSGQALYVGLVVSTNTSKPWSFYDTLSVNSPLDGPLTRLASRHIATMSSQRGSVHIFGLANPTPGTHLISAQLMESDGLTSFPAVAGNSVLYRGVSAAGLAYADGSSAGGNTPTVTATSAVDNMVFFVFGGNNDFSFAFNQTIRHHAGAAGDGTGDFILIGDAPGATTVSGISSIGLTLYGAVAIDIQRLT